MGDLNLIPANRLLRKRIKARALIWVAVCAFVLVTNAVAVASVRCLLRGAGGSLEQELEAVELSIQKCNSTALELSEEIARRIRELKVAEATGIRPDWGRLLSLLAEELGDEVVLSSCHLIESEATDAETDKAPAETAGSGEEAQLPGQNYELRLSCFGRTQTSASALLLRLEAMEFFESVRLLGSSKQTFMDGHAVRFTVVCAI